VWDYPRPPRLEAVTARLVVVLGGETIAHTTHGYRVLETSHPPNYYFPPGDVRAGALDVAKGASFCEWKGRAHYYTVRGGSEVVHEGAWGYDQVVDLVSPQEIDKVLGPEAIHQGVMLETRPLPVRRLEALKDSPLLLVLDQVTDPHNVGAIMRSAVAFNAGAVITTQRHSPTESGVLAKSASGALELIPYIQVTNLADALGELHKLGFSTIGLDSEGPAPLEGTFSGNKVALVLGSEGKGLRQKTRETVNALARLDMPGAIKSLNVSNAAAIALYAARSYLKI